MERKKDSYRLQVESAGTWREGGRERERETGREAWHGCGMDGGELAFGTIKKKADASG